MANYSLIVDSTFQPFSFERYLQPYQMYGEEYRAQEEALSELSTKADIWEGMANEQTDPYAYKMYKSYSNDLNRQAEQLAREGLTPGSRQNILKMKQRYSSDILPIEQAYTRRNQLAEEQRQALLKDPTLMFERMASQMSLDDFIRNPEINYGSSYSGNLLKSAVGEAAANLTKQMKENPRVWRSILNDQYYETVMQRGFTSDDIYRAIQDPESFPELTKIVNDAITSSGIMSWADDATIRKALGHARQGLWNAVGDTQYQNVQNRDWPPTPTTPPSPTLGERDHLSNFSPRIMEGAEGEENKSIKRLEGLRPTSDGFSTIQLDNLRRDVEQLKGQLNTYSQEDIRKFEAHRFANMRASDSPASGVGSYATIGAAASASKPAPAGYSQYMRIKGKYEEALQKYNEEVSSLNSLVEKYAHLGNTPYEQLLTGSELERIQQGQEKTSFAMNLKDSDYNNVRSGVRNLLSAVTQENINSGRVGFVDSKGHSLNYGSTKKLMEKIDSAAIKVSGGNDPQLKIVVDGKEYTIQGIEQLDNYNRDLKVVNDYLRDFSGTIKSYETLVSDETMYEIANNGIMNVRLSNLNIKPIPGSKYKGTVLHNPSSGEYIKILLDNNDTIVAMNSLSEEKSGGATRDAYFINMANVGLDSLLGLVARED